LIHLEKAEKIQKSQDEADKRKTIYTLTETGITTVPILYEIATWGS
jgi:DNA-binding HxlR family transcriptional regulator